jgi:hypothetical protein
MSGLQTSSGSTALKEGGQMPTRTPKPSAEAQRRPNGGPNQVVLWRREQLVRSGLPVSLAAQAAKADYDLHALTELLGRGCPPGLALRILAPIESESLA